MVVKILPLTEGEQEKQYVSLNLVVTLTEGMLLRTNGKSFTGCTLRKWSTFKQAAVKNSKYIPDYPSSPPTLGVRNPRGLDEAEVAGLLADMNTRH